MRIDKSGNPWIAISEFNQQAYCEVQLKYKWEGIVRETKEMIEGSEIHENKLQNFIEETKKWEEVNIEDAIIRAVKNNERFSGREIFIISPTFRIFGMIDSIEIGPDGILIIDDKPTEYAFISEKSQTLAYAIAFKDRFRPPLDVFIIIRNRDTGDIVWEDILTEEWADFMLEKINRLHELATGKREFEPTKNPKKCTSCSYRDICEKKILNSKAT